MVLAEGFWSMGINMDGINMGKNGGRIKCALSDGFI